MASAKPEALVRLDLNNPVFQANLLELQKPQRHAALDTLGKLRHLSWNQVYRDSGLKWEKISSIKPPPGIDAIYSLRITQSRRATAYRDGDFIRLLTIAPDHDSAYGRK
ncbi:hypothetical protein [Rhodoferax sp.]|uniref:hypothetical protein n=1 Tax=Rhodoferax sp. TaxID=50421 RepID=UPI002771A621|nr:hypothetical protein [Rhodoferax sp.]